MQKKIRPNLHSEQGIEVQINLILRHLMQIVALISTLNQQRMKFQCLKARLRTFAPPFSVADTDKFPQGGN